MMGGITKSVLFGFLAFVLLKVFNFAEVFPQIYSMLKLLPSYLIIPIFASLGVVNFEKEGIKGGARRRNKYYGQKERFAQKAVCLGIGNNASL